MKFFNKIKEKENLPILLFFVVLINYIPLFINNAFTKESNAVSAPIMAICFAIEIIVLFIYYIFNRNNIKKIKFNLILSFIFSTIMSIIQIKNFIKKDFMYMDLFNLGCIFVNILLFYVILYNYEIEGKNIFIFFKGIVFVALISVLWNVILYSSEILAIMGIWIEDGLFLHGIKSFFSNRNAFAFFLYISMVSNAFLLNNEPNKKRYLFSIFIILFGIWCSHSKTGFVLSTVFLCLYMLINSKFTIKKRILICTIVGILGILGIMNILGILHFNIINENKIRQSVISSAKNSNTQSVVQQNKTQTNVQISSQTNNTQTNTQTNTQANTQANIKQDEQTNIEIDKRKYQLYKLSEKDLKRMSGRNDIWRVGFEILKKSPWNIIFGVGRFKSTNELKFTDREFTQFHNIYLDIALTGGIVELVYVGYIFLSVIKKILKSNLEKNIKKIYILAYLIYALYIMFESCGRFSIGGVDTLCLVFFIAIPLIWSNVSKKEK